MKNLFDVYSCLYDFMPFVIDIYVRIYLSQKRRDSVYCPQTCICVLCSDGTLGTVKMKKGKQLKMSCVQYEWSVMCIV
jgi:hypothetical protein